MYSIPYVGCSCTPEMARAETPLPICLQGLVAIVVCVGVVLHSRRLLSVALAVVVVVGVGRPTVVVGSVVCWCRTGRWSVSRVGCRFRQFERSLCHVGPNFTLLDASTFVSKLVHDVSHHAWFPFWSYPLYSGQSGHQSVVTFLGKFYQSRNCICQTRPFSKVWAPIQALHFVEPKWRRGGKVVDRPNFLLGLELASGSHQIFLHTSSLSRKLASFGPHLPPVRISTAQVSSRNVQVGCLCWMTFALSSLLCDHSRLSRHQSIGSNHAS